MSVTIYVQRTGGKWEARYWSTDEQRYHRFTDSNKTNAIRKCTIATGYHANQSKIVEH